MTTGFTLGHERVAQTAAVLKHKCCFRSGEMAERLNAPVLKTGVGLRPPGVQIPLSPQT